MDLKGLVLAAGEGSRLKLFLSLSPNTLFPYSVSR